MSKRRDPHDPNNPYRVGQKNEKGITICGGKTKRGTPCGSTAIFPNGRCRNHAGRAPAGVASPTFKHGRYSKILPSGLVDQYEKSINDPALIELRESMALIDARVAELLAMLSDDGTDGGRLWPRMATAWRDLGLAAQMNDRRRQLEMTTLIGEIIEQGSQTFETWDQLADLLERRRKLADSERKRMIDAERMIPADQALVMITAHTSIMLEAVKRYVDDERTIQRIREAASDGLRRFALSDGG